MGKKFAMPTPAFFMISQNGGLGAVKFILDYVYDRLSVTGILGVL